MYQSFDSLEATTRLQLLKPQRGIKDLHDAQGKTPVIILDEAHLIDHDTLQ